MGLYIQGPAKGKAKFILDTMSAEKIRMPLAWDADYDPENKCLALVCVMDNGGFDAAMYVNSERELKYMHSICEPDQRDKAWLILPYSSLPSYLRK